jgi:prepilin-type N-terminal cleavage/methylation domain-containing protein
MLQAPTLPCPWQGEAMAQRAYNPGFRGFTLVEILIVVVLLAILAALAIPQFGQATSDSRSAALMSDIQTFRRQLQVYKAEHTNTFPGQNIVAQLTQFSDPSGNTSATRDALFPHGPYVASFPKNPISGIATVRFAQSAGDPFVAPSTDGGWYYNTFTGEIRADLADSHMLTTGLVLNQF